MTEILRFEGRPLFYSWCSPGLSRLVFRSPSDGSNHLPRQIILLFEGVRYIKCRMRNWELALYQPTAEEARELLDSRGLNARGAIPWILDPLAKDFVLAESLIVYANDLELARDQLNLHGDYILADQSEILFRSAIR